MQISVESTGELGRKLKVLVPSQEIETRVKGRIRDLGKQVKLKGFRPGKVPYQVLEKRFGPEVRKEVVGEMIQASFQEAVTRHNLQPASSPEIAAEPPRPDTDLEYTASFEVFPELAELNLSELEIVRPVAEVTDSDVANMVETLRQQRRTWADVERPAAEGDLVFFHFSMTAGDTRHPAEGEERAAAILGQHAFDPACEAELVGLKTGGEKAFQVDLDADFREPSVAGQKVQVAVRIEKVQEPVLPEVDEEFFAAFGVTEGGEAAFLNDVRDNLKRELKQGLSRKLKNRVMEELVTRFADLKVPVSMVEAEKEALRQQVAEQLKASGAEDRTPPAERFAAQAERRVRAALLVREVARHGHIEVDSTRVREAINEVASTYEHPQAIVNLYYSDERMLTSVQNMVLEEQAVEWILERAQVEERKMSFDEVMRPAPAAAS